MSNPEDRKILYRNARSAVALNKRQWARLMNLGDLGKNNMHIVGKKELPASDANSRGVSKVEALASELIRFLHEKGYDVGETSFSDEGELLSIPRRCRGRPRE